jgi:Cu2+-exporting ATPase
MLLEIIIISGFIYGGDVIRKKLAPSKEQAKDHTKGQTKNSSKEYRQKYKKCYSESDDPLRKKKHNPQLKSISSITENHQIAEYKNQIDKKTLVSGVSTIFSAAGSFYKPFYFLSIPGLLYASTEILKSAYNSLFIKKKMNIDFLIFIITVVCASKGFWFVCNLNIFLAMYNRKLLLKTKDNSQKDVIDVFSQQPKKAWVLCNGMELEQSVETLKQGDIVVINAGETIPIDGYIISGTASIDQHILTGESQLAEKGPNEKVFALTVVLSGRIEVMSEKTGQATTAAQIAQVLNKAGSLKTDMQLSVERIGEKGILPTLIFSGMCLTFIGTRGATAILNSHPRYKTTIATYSGLLNFLSIASQKAILVKDGRVFELLNKVDTVVFDKTGTLTENRLHVGKVYTCETYTKDEILTWAATAEQRQKHPIAQAILREAEARDLNLQQFDETECKVGFGLIVKRNDNIIRVGSIRFMKIEQLDIPPEIREIQRDCHDQGHSLVLVAVNDKVIGGIELHATLREEAVEVIKGLRQRKVKSVYIISGDNETSTKNLSDYLGVEKYYAEVLPEQKADIIDQLQKEGRNVCFIGDGINDSIALKKADVSISLKGASTVATDTAQIVLMDGSLKNLCSVFDLAYEYDTNMKITFAIVLIPHVISVAGALFFHFGLIRSVVINQLGLLLGISNSALPRIQDRKKNSEELAENEGERSGWL